LHKDRHLQGSELHQNEFMFAYVEEKGDDLHLFAPIAGPRCSSTRTETAAVLLSICKPGPASIATDSLSVVRTMHALLANKPRKKPWSLIPNGDLWEVIERFVSLKGARSIRTKWVKGHTAVTDVHSGVISMAEHLGNSAADLLADKGVTKHPQGLEALGNVYAFRRLIYLRLLHSIHTHIVKVFLAAQERRKTEERTAWAHGQDFTKVFLTLPPPGLAPHARKVVPWWPQPHTIPQNSYLFMQVWHFLSNLSVSPRSVLTHTGGQCEQGTSWLELLCLFELWGGCLEQDILGVRLTLRACLAAFRKVLLQVCSLCLPREDAFFFKPSKSPIVRLRCAGISNFVPCINGIVMLEDADKAQMLPCLVALSARLSKNVLEQLRKGIFQAKPCRLSQRGCPAWRKSICPRQVIPDRHMLHTRPHDLVCSIIIPVSFRIACPDCGHKIPVAQRTLYGNGKWTQLTCTSCFRHATARKWKCACGSFWVGCPLHAQIGFACKTRANKRLQPTCIKRVKGGSPKRCTNHLPPPTPEQCPAPKKARMVPPGSAFSSSASGLPFPSGGPWDKPRGVKRVASKAPSQRPARPMPSSRNRVSSAIQAIDRLREAKANPLH
jgi:ribonuclease HI